MYYVGADPWVALVVRRVNPCGCPSPSTLALNHAVRRSYLFTFSALHLFTFFSAFSALHLFTFFPLTPYP
jgi:hypothetical protein